MLWVSRSTSTRELPARIGRRPRERATPTGSGATSTITQKDGENSSVIPQLDIRVLKMRSTELASTIMARAPPGVEWEIIEDGANRIDEAVEDTPDPGSSNSSSSLTRPTQPTSDAHEIRSRDRDNFPRSGKSENAWSKEVMKPVCTTDGAWKPPWRSKY